MVMIKWWVDASFAVHNDYKSHNVFQPGFHCLPIKQTEDQHLEFDRS